MNIIIIDDHSLFRRGIQSMLSTLDATTVIKDFNSCEDAISKNEDKESINLVLLDYHLPNSESESNIKLIREEFSNAKIVIISGEEDPEMIIKALESGVAGFIPKSSDHKLLIAALELVLAGGIYLPQQVLLYQMNAAEHGASQAGSPIDNLSERQQEVLFQAIDGKVNKVIARELGLSVGTVKAHLSAGYRALGVSNRTEALFVASKYLNKS